MEKPEDYLENIEQVTPAPTAPMRVLVLKDKLLFPHVTIPITLSRPSARQLIADSLNEHAVIAVACQKDKHIENPGADDIYPLGVVAEIVRVMDIPSGKQVVVLRTQDRIRIQEVETVDPYMQAYVAPAPEQLIPDNDPDGASIAMAVVSTLHSVRFEDPQQTESLRALLTIVPDPNDIINLVCSTLAFEPARAYEMLACSDLKERGTKLQKLLNEVASYSQQKENIRKKTDRLINKEQREYFLQQEMQAIRKELGDTEDRDAKDFRERAKKKEWSEAVARRFETEVHKLEKIGTRSAEYPVQFAYLELMLSLPWNHKSKDDNNLVHAEKVLNQYHYGMEKVKERIIEYLAANNRRGMILCLYGPPGVGKTSVAKSVAIALKRQYARIALGGMHDEAEIRGHRRTYIGAMPGRIIDSIKRVGTSNPVIVLDEIDKLYANTQGDPTSALLEVLDPEQNNTFHDNYLDMDYDLSQVLFIATANNLSSVPRPLLDRMELVEMTGYLQEEKEQIAKRYLIPRQLKEQEIASKDLRFSIQAIRTLIDDYTRESGVRELERQIASIIRKVLKSRALGQDMFAAPLQPEDIHRLLGKPRYSRDRYEGNDYPGVVTGLAWTEVGGEILFIETSLIPCKQPVLTLTGNLGDVMKESATIAYTYVKSHASDFGIAQEKIDGYSVHLHVPEGAVPKDGPSAGITMTTAIISIFTGRKVRERLAMTGEMTLRGKVLPVGGIKEKILAAKRAGITDLILCHENEKDIQEIPESYLKGLSFHYVRDAHEVMDFALL